MGESSSCILTCLLLSVLYGGEGLRGEHRQSTRMNGRKGRVRKRKEDREGREGREWKVIGNEKG